MSSVLLAYVAIQYKEEYNKGMLDFIIFFVAVIIIGWLVLVIVGGLVGFFSPPPKPYVSKYKDSDDGDILD